MQIKYKEKSIDIIDKKITGIVSNSVSNIIKFNENLGNEYYGDYLKNRYKKM